MAKKTALSVADQQRLNEIIDAIILQTDDVGTAQVTDALATEIQRMASGGDVWACHLESAIRFDGLYSRVERRLSDERAFISPKPGTRVSVPARMGVAKRELDPAADDTYVQPIFWTLPWRVFLGKIDRLRSDLRQLGLKIEALEAIAHLYDLYPDTATPLEACERAGKDPAQFDASSIAV